MAITIVKGNLLTLAYQGKFDVIVHGCNCFNTMGAGIAKEIATHIPKAQWVDNQTQKGGKGKLGRFTTAKVYFGKAQPLYVVNAYTQYYYGTQKPGEEPHFNYKAFARILSSLSEVFGGKRFGFPRIGSGLGRADEKEVEELIKEYLSEERVTIVDWDGTSFNRH